MANDNYRLAELFWLRCTGHVANALVASAVLKGMSKSTALRGQHMHESRKKMRHNAEKFETLAVGLMNRCYEDDPRLTAELLNSSCEVFEGDSALKVAFLSHSLEFLSHRAAINSRNQV